MSERGETPRASLLVNSGYATITAGSAALLLVLLIAAARLLNAADYGRFAYALALATIVETVMDIGLGHVTVRAIARDRSSARRVFRDVLGLKCVWVAVGLVLMLVTAPLLRTDPAVIQACYLLGFSSAIRSYLLTIRGVLQGIDRFDIEAATVVADRVVLLVVGTVVMALGYGLLGLALAFVGARLVMLLAVMAMMSRVVGVPLPSFNRSAWRELQAGALPLGLFVVAFNLCTYIDTIMLGVMRSNEETGLYAAAYRVYEGLTYVPSILGAVLTPRLSYLFVQDQVALRRMLLRALGASAGLGIVLGGVAVWAAGPVVALLFGPAYAPAVAPLRILAGGAVFVFCTWILHAAAIATNLDRRLLGVTVISLGSNVGLNLLFIPRWGIQGSAWATVASEALTVIVLLVQILKVVRLGKPEAPPASHGPREFGNTQANIQFLERSRALANDPEILEIGAGTGTMLNFLRSQGHRVHGVDVNAELVAEARHWYGDLPLQLTRNVELPFPDSSFDLVLSFDVFEHIHASDAHLEEVRRVLRPNGSYLIQTPNKWTNVVFETIRWRSFTKFREDHCSLHTLGQLEARLSQHGFDVRAFDVPVVNEFFRQKVRRYLGGLGLATLAVVNPDRLPLAFRTNLYVQAVKRR